jgi:hypothetical protein
MSDSQASQGGRIMVNAFDGTRKPTADGTDLLLTITDGNQKQLWRNSYKGPSNFFTGLPIFGNSGDNYTVLAASDGYKDAGFFPVRVTSNVDQIVDLMLIPRDGTINFSGASRIAEVVIPDLWNSCCPRRAPHLDSQSWAGCRVDGSCRSYYPWLARLVDG